MKISSYMNNMNPIIEKNDAKVQKENKQANEKHTMEQSVKLSISNDGMEHYRKHIQQNRQETYDDVLQRRELLKSEKIRDIDYGYEISKKAAELNKDAANAGQNALSTTDRANGYVAAYAELYDEIVSITKMANIQYVRQKETKGLGHAVWCAKSFVGDDPFAVMYGDDVIISDLPACGQLCRAYEEFGLATVGIKEVTAEQILKYSSLKTEPIRDNLFRVTDMIEKPKPDQVLSLYSILGRCVLPSKIFDILENTKPGAGGEIQLTDAMLQLARTEGMVGVDYIGTRYDMGNKLGILQASVEVGLKHPEIGAELREYLKKLAKTL